MASKIEVSAFSAYNPVQERLQVATNRNRSSARGFVAALFAPVEGRWLDDARRYLEEGHHSVDFVTGASIGKATDLNIHYVYFKKTGETQVSARADLEKVGKITERSQPLHLLPGNAKIKPKFWYEFRNLTPLGKPIPLSSLRYHSTDTALRNDVPGARIIKEPTASGSKT